MAVNLTATARLNTGPYAAGMAKLASMTASLTGAQVAGASKVLASEEKITASREAQRGQILARARAEETAARQVAASQDKAAKSSAAMAQGLSSQRYLFHDLSRQMATYSVGLAAFPVAALVAGAAWEKDFVNVVRTSDLKDDLEGNRGRIEALRNSLVGMTQAMPASFGAITEVATLANQMGIAASDTAEFTRAVIMFSEASGVSVDQTATAFGRMKTLVQDVGTDFIGLSDSILKVGVNSVATESEIINVTTQISSIAAQAGFTSKEMVALSGALASVRVPPELSRGVVTRVFGQFDKAVAKGGTSLDTLARISGRTSEQFRQQWGREGSAELFNDILKGLRDAGSAARSEIESLGITSVRDVPVLLRLANANDSRGVKGGLFTQTLQDANNAAGETQAQYTLMAETVAGKMKILGNNIVAFFEGVGQSGLGMFGDILDNLTKGIRDFTRSLDEPMQILPGLKLPWTNAEALGFVATASLIASGLAGLASIALKVSAGIVGMRQLGAVTAGLSLFGGGKAVKGLRGAESAVTGMTGAMLAAPGAASGFSKLAGTVTRFINPFTAAATIAATTVGYLWDQFYDVPTTQIDALSQSLSRVDTESMNSLNNALSQITVSGQSEFWSSGSFVKTLKPFEAGVAGYQDAVDALMAARAQAENSGDPNIKWTGLTFEMSQWAARNGQGLWDEVEGMRLVDESIQSMVDSGNTDRAINLVRNLAKDTEQLKYIMDSTEGSNIRDLMENTFAAAGIEMTDRNLHAFVNGSLKDLSNAITGFEEGDKIANTLFGGDVEQMGKFAESVDTAAAAFIDFNAALETGWKDAEGNDLETFSLSNYTQELKRSIDAQNQWSEDLQTVADHASVGLVQTLAELGPAAAPALAALAEELRAGVTTSLDGMEEALEARTTGLGNALAESMSNIAWAKRMTGDENLGKLLATSLGDSEMSQLYDAAQGVGEKTVEEVMQGLARGKVDFEGALEILAENQPPLPVEIELDSAAADRSFSALTEKFGRYSKDGDSLTVPLEIDSDTTVAELQSFISDPGLEKIEIDGELTLEEAYAESRAFQAWAEAQGVDFLLGANDAPAVATFNTLMGLMNGSVSQVQIDALGAPAEGKLWQFIQLADGSTGFVQLDAETGRVESAFATVVDEAGNVVAEVELTAENTEAINAITSVEGKASETKPVIHILADPTQAEGVLAGLNGRTTRSTHYIDVVQNGSVVGVRSKDGAGTLTQANGGVISYFANGGVRENHTAQIAPAGTMRVWAEPETGGEGYIPLARSKRKRSTAVLSDIAHRFGYSLTRGAEMARFANGGQYQAQQFSRSAPASVRDAFGGGLSASDRQFFAHLFRTVVVTADSQAITGLTNDINTKNARFGR